MTRTYKTAKGKVIDMDKIKLANETVTAVGNMKVNARGDKLGPGGQIVAGRNQVMDRVYAVDSGGYSPNNPEILAERQAMMEASKAKELHDLANNLVNTSSAEPIVDAESESVEKEPTARGSLASSVAKTAVVKQEPLPNPKKPTGPTRI